MSTAHYAKFLSHIPIFKGLSADQIAEVARLFDLQDLLPDTVLCREGDPGDRVFVIERGTVHVTKKTAQEDEQLIAELTGPTVVGEICLLDPAPRSATVTARSQLTVYVFPVAEFSNLLGNGSVAAYGVVRNPTLMLCDRLRQTNERIDEFFADPQGAMKTMVERQKRLAKERLASRGDS